MLCTLIDTSLSVVFSHGCSVNMRVYSPKAVPACGAAKAAGNVPLASLHAVYEYAFVHQVTNIPACVEAEKPYAFAQSGY